MKVLVCDDDPASRFVLKRLLTQHLGCTVIECSDGVEAMARLDEGLIDLVLLDLDMPHVDGRAVLQVIRATPSLAWMPVIMITSERRQDQVVSLVRMGLDGYVLKPLRAATLLAALEPIRARLVKRQGSSSAGDTSVSWFGPEQPAMLVDGSLDYRHFFVTTAASVGPVLDVHSGADAITAYLQTTTRLVFIGAELGVFGPELLVPKLKHLADGRPLRVVGLADHADTSTHLFDDVIPRSFVPDVLHRALRGLTDPDAQ